MIKISLILALWSVLINHSFTFKSKMAILGASGYTGAELARILVNHPQVDLAVLTADRSAGQDFKSIYPQFSYLNNLTKLTKWEDSQSLIEQCDVAFCCLPHGTTQEIISKLATNSQKVKIIDLSADFRLKDVTSYEKWYGKPHVAPKLQEEAVYGLTEINREKIRSCRLLANPGCYPTAAQLPLIPLLQSNLISSQDIIIDAKSGTTGAGRAAKEAFLYCEVTEGIHAYGVASHRHVPEIEQGLKLAVADKVGDELLINFTPHLIPMTRGILETIYVKIADPSKVTVTDLKACLTAKYASEPFVTVITDGYLPQTRHVKGSNHCFINVVADRIPGRAIIISAIDNLVKGASGQAVQNMNVMMGWEETMGLMSPPMFP